MMIQKTLQLELGERSYPIRIGPGLLSQTALYEPAIRGRQVMVISNDTVAPLYMDTVCTTLHNYQLEQLILPDGEQYKTLDILNRIFDALLENRFNRSCCLVALGGGVIGDMVGFAAASYQRGVDFIQIPTTLLAQVDSSVGGKTGVNHPLGKNMIGAFYQPRLVLADTDTLNTLDERQLSAGIAEVIKYGLIEDREFFEWLEINMQRLLERGYCRISWFQRIAHCCGPLHGSMSLVRELHVVEEVAVEQSLVIGIEVTLTAGNASHRGSVVGPAFSFKLVVPLSHGRDSSLQFHGCSNAIAESEFLSKRSASVMIVHINESWGYHEIRSIDDFLATERKLGNDGNLVAVDTNIANSINTRLRIHHATALDDNIKLEGSRCGSMEGSLDDLRRSFFNLMK